MKINKLEKPALVGIVPRKDLWQVIQSQRWYHIPVKSAPRNISYVEHISFYFPKIFGEELKFKVLYYAPVLKMETVKRVELFPDEPEHPRSNMDYHKLCLGNIEKLPRPIPSRRFRRIVHIPTTLSRLFSAEEINDLYDTSPIEDKMYRTLKKRRINPERQFYVNIGSQIFCLDFCIFCQKANIDVECDGERYHNFPDAFTKDRIRNNQLTSFGWSVLRFSGKEIYHNLKYSLSMIEKTISTLGGLTG